MASGRIITEGIPSASGAGGRLRAFKLLKCAHQGLTGAVPLRREIRSLEKDFPHQWTLYILGLRDFQCVEETSPKSYYQIAGIHGRPYNTYDGAEDTKNRAEDTKTGAEDTKYGAEDTKTGAEDTKYGAEDTKTGAENTKYGAEDTKTGAEDTKYGAEDTKTGAEDTKIGAGKTTTGYCTHQSILFPTWHRPYLVLFEQSLYEKVNEIAARFPESEGRASYVAAAKDFRIPYWDWAAVLDAGTEFVPTSLSSKQLKIVGPESKGMPDLVDNPLYSFKFHPINPRSGDFPKAKYNLWEETVRWPKDDTSESQNNLISEVRELNNRGRRPTDSSSNLRETLYQLLASYKSYGPFSNTRWEKHNPGQFAGSYGSLESIHDTIHGKVGGSGLSCPGHMADVAYAAFDPAFWLHHANIDRLFAIWQAMNPDCYVTPQEAKNDTVTTRKGTKEHATTGLAPFRRKADASRTSDGDPFWTSDEVRKTETFNYAYPETQCWNFETRDKYCKNVQATVKELYGASSLSYILEKSTPGNLSNRAELIVPSNAQHDITDLVTNGKYLEWIVNVKVEKHCLGGTFSVSIFLGDFERDDPSKWDSTANIVGSISVLGDDEDTGCVKCQSDRENHLVITGQVPLTLALAERYLGGKLANLGSKSVVDHLKEYLHWRVIFSDGNEIPRSQVPSLTVSVISNEVTLPGSPEELPRFAKEFTVWADATTARNHIDGRGSGTGLTDQAQI